MKKIILFIVFLVCNVSFSQISLTKETQKKFNNTPNENVFIHYNANFLLTGESLKYKVYLLNSKSNTLSSMSKVAYVELVGEGNQSIFTQKIKLENGQGYGDYLLTSKIKSGTYKLIGYTLWMKNQKQESFFIENITIINPFEDKLLPNTKEIVQTNNSFIEKNEAWVSLNKNEFKKREKVSLNISKLVEVYPLGNYSLSVRKFDAINKLPKTSTLDFINTNTNSQKVINLNQEMFLPEFRGSILYGTIASNTPEKTLGQVKVSLSIPGKDNYSKIIETNDSGEFIFNINDTYQNAKAFVQILDNDKSSYSLTIKDLTKNEYENLTFQPVETNDEIDQLIQQRSVYNQIENAYLEKKSDVILEHKNSPQAFKNNALEFRLDDYTRFNSIKEIFIEIIQNSHVREKDGNYTFYVTGNQKNSGYDVLPLILIDGLVAPNHNDLFNINPKSIKTIWIYKDLYNFGANIYQGVIAVETFKSDYANNIVFYEKHHKILDLFKPQLNKKYFNPEYFDNSKDRIPDFRHQLYWEPNLNLEKETAEIIFYTSDNTGVYEINIEGFSSSGEPISVKKYFQVK